MTNKEDRKGYGKILDAWQISEGAGVPIGCVATSFTFSPALFEEECLSRFLGLETDPHEDGPLYLVEREEKLAQATCAALVDQHHCRGSRSLRWDLLPARMPAGILHGKVSLLHWSKMVRIIVASANLTEDGYRRNQEVFGVLDYQEGGRAPLGGLKVIVSFLRESVRYSLVEGKKTSRALERWNSLLEKTEKAASSWGVPEGRARRSGAAVVVTGPGLPDAYQQLHSIWPGGSPAIEANVVSPFFDPPEAPNVPAREVWSLLRKRGKATLRYHLATEEVPGENALFLNAPESLVTAGLSERSGVETVVQSLELEANRPLHAKGLWLEDDRWAVYSMGSSNFTSAGLGLGKRPNLEVNLVYTVDRRKSTTARRQLERSFLWGKRIDSDMDLKWRPLQIEGEDGVGEELLLPMCFVEAVFDLGDKGQGGAVMLAINGETPKGWELLAEEDGETLLYSEKKWVEGGAPNEVTLPWEKTRPPSGFWVKWEGSGGLAWWPVNVASASSLPPPEELRDLPLDVLIDVLTSARPLHRAIQRHLKRKKSGEVDVPVIDPHKRVDTSGFLLRRTRRVASALNALRERLERPVSTESGLHWRLRGPVGVTAVADAIVKEARTDGEKAFLISELALEISRAKPRTAPGCLPVKGVKAEIARLVTELRGKVPTTGKDIGANLEKYLVKVFEELGA